MSDQTIEERIDEILDFHALNHSYKSWSSKDEAKQALLQLLNKARIEAYKHGLMTGSLPEALGKPIAKDYLAQLTPKENK